MSLEVLNERVDAWVDEGEEQQDRDGTGKEGITDPRTSRMDARHE